MTHCLAGKLASVLVVDFSQLFFDTNDADLKSELFQVNSNKVMVALSNFGFLYLKNTCLKLEESKEFSEVVGDLFSRIFHEIFKNFGQNRYHGWVPVINILFQLKQSYSIHNTCRFTNKPQRKTCYNHMFLQIGLF